MGGSISNKKSLGEQYWLSLQNVAESVAKSDYWKRLPEDVKQQEIEKSRLDEGVAQKLSKYQISRYRDNATHSILITVSLERVWQELPLDDRKAEIALNLLLDLKQYRKLKKFFQKMGVVTW